MTIWERKTIGEVMATAEASEHQLKRTLGPWSLIALGIGVIIGAGLFSITGTAAAEYAGPAVLISFVIAAIGCALAGLCYSELASMLPISGSAYTFAYVTMGELFAWMIGWTLILEYAIGAAAVSISWSAYVLSLLHEFNIFPSETLIASPWHPARLPDGTFVHGLFNLPAVLIVMLASLILIRGMKESAIVTNVLVVVKLTVVAIFIFAGVHYIHYDNFFPFIPENNGSFGEYGWSGIMRAAGVVFFAYIGFDCVSTASQETINPQRNMPIGILGSLIICTILYIVFAFVMVGLVNYKDLNVAAPVALAIDQTPYGWLAGLVKLAILAGMSSVILVLLMGQSRIFYAMARDGLLPPSLAGLSRWHTPWKLNLIVMAFVSIFSAFFTLELLGKMISIGTLFAFAIVCCAVLILRYRHPEYPRTFKTPGVPYVPILGVATCLMLMFSLDIDTWIRLIVWLIVGMVIYFGYGKKNSVTAREHRKMEQNLTAEAQGRRNHT